MNAFVMTASRAAFGWPFFVTWNLVAYAKEQERSSAKAMVALCAIHRDLHDRTVGGCVVSNPLDDIASRELKAGSGRSLIKDQMACIRNDRNIIPHFDQT